MTSDSFEIWAVVELMGHVRMAGKVSEEERFGAKMGRIEIPHRETCGMCSGQTTEFLQANKCTACGGRGYHDTWTTQYFAGSAIYRISPVAEELARAVAAANKAAPINPYEMPGRLLTNSTFDDDNDPR